MEIEDLKSLENQKLGVQRRESFEIEEELNVGFECLKRKPD